MLDFLCELMAAAAQDPAVFFLALLCVFVAGLLAGYGARRQDDADARTLATPLRTDNSGLVDLQARHAMHNAGVRPRARAGTSPLKPSYDGRKQTAANDYVPTVPTDAP